MKVKILILIPIIIFFMVFLVFAYSFNHNYSDDPVHSDIIVVLTGSGDKGRMMKAGELYNEGYAEKVLITPVIEGSDKESVEAAIDLGIKEEDILTDYQATSTYTNAIETINTMDNHEMETAIIVTNDYHIKRSKLIYERLKPQGMSFYYIPAYSEDNKRWYEREYAKYYWHGELYKYWGYNFGLYKYIDQ